MRARLAVAGFLLGIGSTAIREANASLDMPAQYFWFGPHLTRYHYEVVEDMSSTPGEATLAGLQFGYRLNPAWSVRASWETNDRPSEGFSGNVELGLVGIQRHLPLGFTSWEPWLGAGGGEVVVESDGADGRNGASESVYAASLGIQKRLLSSWTVTLGAQGIHSRRRENWDTAAFVAVNFVFVTRVPAPPPPEPIRRHDAELP